MEQQSPSLLDLPRECRDLIFSYIFPRLFVFVHSDGAEKVKASSKTVFDGPVQASVLRVSKQFSIEIWPALAEAICVTMHIHPNCKDLAPCLSKGLVQNIKYVETTRALDCKALSKFPRLEVVEFKEGTKGIVYLKHRLDDKAFREELKPIHPGPISYEYGRGLLLAHGCSVYCAKYTTYRLQENGEIMFHHIGKYDIKTKELVSRKISIPFADWQEANSKEQPRSFKQRNFEEAIDTLKWIRNIKPAVESAEGEEGEENTDGSDVSSDAPHAPEIEPLDDA